MLSGLTEDEASGQPVPPLCQTPVSASLQFAAEQLLAMTPPGVATAADLHRPASADSYFYHQAASAAAAAAALHGYDETGDDDAGGVEADAARFVGQLEDPAVLSNSTLFYTNFNAEFARPTASSVTALMASNPWCAGGVGVGGSLQDLVASDRSGGAKENGGRRTTVADRFLSYSQASHTTTHAQSGDTSGEGAEAATPGGRADEQPTSSLEIAKAMLKDLHVPACKDHAAPAVSAGVDVGGVPDPDAPAVIAGDSEPQSQAAEVVPPGTSAEEVAAAGTSETASAGAGQNAADATALSPTEALMRALRACSPHAKLSAAESFTFSSSPETQPEDGEPESSDLTDDARDSSLEMAEEFLMTPQQRRAMDRFFGDAGEDSLAESSPDGDAAARGSPAGGSPGEPTPSPKRSLSDSGSSPGEASPWGTPVKQGSPRKVRIAARFDVPIEVSSDEGN